MIFKLILHLIEYNFNKIRYFILNLRAKLIFKILWYDYTLSRLKRRKKKLNFAEEYVLVDFELCKQFFLNRVFCCILILKFVCRYKYIKHYVLKFLVIMFYPDTIEDYIIKFYVLRKKSRIYLYYFYYIFIYILFVKRFLYAIYAHTRTSIYMIKFLLGKFFYTYVCYVLFCIGNYGYNILKYIYRSCRTSIKFCVYLFPLFLLKKILYIFCNIFYIIFYYYFFRLLFLIFLDFKILCFFLLIFICRVSFKIYERILDFLIYVISPPEHYNYEDDFDERRFQIFIKKHEYCFKF